MDKDSFLHGFNCRSLQTNNRMEKGKDVKLRLRVKGRDAYGAYPLLLLQSRPPQSLPMVTQQNSSFVSVFSCVSL